MRSLHKARARLWHLCRGLALAALPVLLCAGTALASGWEAAAATGSQRLLLFTLLTERPAGGEPLALALMQRNGLTRDASSAGWQHSFRGRPLLQFDDNINGGVPKDRFTLGGLDFQLDPDQQAKSGFVLGGQVTAATRRAIGVGQVLSFAGYASALYSFDHDIATQSASVETCLGSRIGSWTWLDTCGGHRVQNGAFSTQSETYASLGLSQVFASRYGTHEARVVLRHGLKDDYDQTVVQLQLASALAGIDGVTLGLDLGQPVEGVNTQSWGIDAALTRDVLGRSTTLSVAYDRESGSEFFGTAREDDVYLIGLSRTLTDRLSVSVSYTDRRSTIDLYQDSTVFAGVRLRGW